MGLIDQWLGISEGAAKTAEAKKALADILNPPTVGKELNAPAAPTPEAAQAFTQAMQQYKAQQANMPTPQQAADNAELSKGSFNIPTAPTPVAPTPPVNQRAQFAASLNVPEQVLGMEEKNLPMLKTIGEFGKEQALTNALKGQKQYWVNTKTNELSLAPKDAPEDVAAGWINPGKAGQAATIAAQGNRVQAKQTQTQMSPEDTAFYGSMYADTGKMPEMGFGNPSARLQIMHAAAQEFAKRGENDKAMAVNKATYAAGQTALSSLTKNQSQVMAFEQTAQKNLELADSLSNQVDRTGSPIVNKWLNAGRINIEGDPATTAFNLAIRTSINEYAKVVSSASGGNITTDSARKEIEDQLNAAQGPEQIKAVMNTMRTEMQNRSQGFVSQIQTIKQQMVGLNAPSAVKPQGNNSPPPPTDSRTNAAIGYLKNYTDPTTRKHPKITPANIEWAKTQLGTGQ